MQQCATSTKTCFVKRVSVRSGGAGHAQSGVTTAASSTFKGLSAAAKSVKKARPTKIRI